MAIANSARASNSARGSVMGFTNGPPEDTGRVQWILAVAPRYPQAWGIIGAIMGYPYGSPTPPHRLFICCSPNEANILTTDFYQLCWARSSFLMDLKGAAPWMRAESHGHQEAQDSTCDQQIIASMWTCCAHQIATHRNVGASKYRSKHPI